MRKLIVTIMVVSVGTMMLLLGGCGQQTKATLEDIVGDNPEIEKTISEAVRTPEGMTSEVTFSGDSFDITYSFKDKIDDDDEKALVSAFDKNVETVQADFEKAISDLEKQTGITGITGTLHIFNASGKETWTQEFPKK